MDLHTYASANRVNETRTQQKQEQHNDDYCQQRQQTGPTAVAAARSNGGQLRTIEPPIVRLMTPCLGGCALTYASARGLHTQKKRKSQHTAHSKTSNNRTVPRLFSAAVTAANRPNSSSTSTPQRRRLGRGRGQVRASEPPIVCLTTPCIGGCVLFASVTYALVFVDCVVSGVLCVVCWPFLAMIRIVVMYVVREWITLLA